MRLIRFWRNEAELVDTRPTTKFWSVGGYRNTPASLDATQRFWILDFGRQVTGGAHTVKK